MLLLRQLRSDIDEATSRTLRAASKQAETSSPESYIDALRLIAALTKFEEKGEVLSMLGRVTAQGQWGSLPLASALRGLIMACVGETPDTAPPSSNLVESGAHLLEKRLPQPLLSAELALVALATGLITGDTQRTSHVIAFGEWHSHLLDYSGAPFTALWTRASEYNPYRLTLLTYLLFASCYHMTQKEMWRRLADSCERRLASLDGAPTPYDIFLAHTLHNGLEGAQLTPQPDTSLSLPPLFSHLTPEMSLILTPSGYQTGIGALRKNGVAFPTFGPHFEPLGREATYGICHPEPLTQKENRAGRDASFSMWMPLVSPVASATAGKNWMHVEVKAEGERVAIDVMPVMAEASLPISFAFFASAPVARVGSDMSYEPAMLESYSGDTAPIAFGEESSCTLHAEGASSMRLIPLAGGPHFWGASFLASYRISEKSRFYIE